MIIGTHVYFFIHSAEVVRLPRLSPEIISRDNSLFLTIVRWNFSMALLGFIISFFLKESGPYDSPMKIVALIISILTLLEMIVITIDVRHYEGMSVF